MYKVILAGLTMVGASDIPLTSFDATLAGIWSQKNDTVMGGKTTETAKRMCPAYPKSCDINPEFKDIYGEFIPVCLVHFPQIGGLAAEYQTRRCMDGEKAPYFQDSQGAFRCACCGALLWKPSQQFDQQPAERWGWPSFHSPPLEGDDGQSNVCHRGPGIVGAVNTDATEDLGLGVTGEVSCARCGIHLGDYFDDDDSGHDHYCIDGACMIPPGGADGSTCPPTTSDILA